MRMYLEIHSALPLAQVRARELVADTVAVESDARGELVVLGSRVGTEAGSLYVSLRQETVRTS